MMNVHRWKPARVGMGQWRHWLTDRGSLTQRLKSHCPTFRVKRLSQAVGMPFRDEAEPLRLGRNRLALIREVVLMCGDTPLIFAHTVIPLESLRSPWQSLAGLGNQSLGATLFSDPKVERFPLEFCRLTRRDPLFRDAVRHLTDEVDHLWARRSLFAMEGHRVEVSEVFLPPVFALGRHP